MKLRISKIACAIGVLMAACAGETSAQSAVTGPYYASPTWDQTLPASTRFLVLSNFSSQAVLDRETGLVWQRAINGGRVAYEDAYFGCASATTGGRLGWRLPTIGELSSIFDPNSIDPSFLPTGHPFTGYPTFPTGTVAAFWSSTYASYADPDLGGAPHNSRLAVSAIGGTAVRQLTIYLALENTELDSYWCVRGGSDNGSAPVTSSGRHSR